MEDIKYTMRKSERARNIRITVERSGEVFVTIPPGKDDKEAEIFVEKHKEWIRRKAEYFLKNPLPAFWEKIKSRAGSKKEFKNRKGEALALIEEKIKKFNNYYNFSYKKIVIRNQKSRWGSCSKKENLNFNYRIIFLPPEIQDYIIVHELCHLKELNHSKSFWSLVSKQIPDYKDRRKKLKIKN